MPSFKYSEQTSSLFGKVFRPLIGLEIYSEIEKEWIRVKNVLADTAADISILPKNTGELILADFTNGKIQEVKGIVPYAAVYIHNLRFRINSREFELPVAIADSDDVLPILGRVKGLDLFSVNFDKGETVALEE